MLLRAVHSLVLLCIPVIVLAQGPTSTPLKIAHTSPQGVTSGFDQSQTIYVTFDRPVVPLAAPLGPGTSVPMKIEPEVPGKFRWVGTTTLAFISAGRLPFSTRFTVTIPPGVTSLTGEKLGEGHSWTFETPRPKVLRMIPQQGQKHVELDHSIILHFNQPIDPQVVARSISIREIAGPATTYPAFSAAHPSEKDARGDSTYALLLLPTQPFTIGASLSVECRAGLQGREGPLPMAEPFYFYFTTYGPFRFVELKSVQNYRPDGQLTFVFSNPATIGELLTHLWIDPKVQIPKEGQGWWRTNELSVRLPLSPETEYRGLVKAGMQDQFGNTLAADAPFTFRTGSYPPYVRMVTGPGVLEATEAHRLPVSFMNKDSVLLQLGRVSPEGVIELMQEMERSYAEPFAMQEGILLSPDGTSGAASLFEKGTMWRSGAKRNTRVVKPLDLDLVLKPARRGIVFAQIDNMDEENRRYLKTLVQVTEMGITGKFSPEENLIWVTRLKDATPVAGASVEIRNDSNRVLWRGKTDGKGLALTPGWGTTFRGEGEEDEYGYRRQPRQWVLVKKGEDVAFSSSRWNRGLEPWVFGVDGEWNPQMEKTEAVIFTDRGLYRVGEKVEIKGITRVRNKAGWKIGRGLPLRLTVWNSRNEELQVTEPAVSAFGSFSLQISLQVAAPLGTYSMRLERRMGAKGSGRWEQIAWGDFRVEAFRPAEFEVTGQPERKEVIVGDTAVAFLSARYLFGAPLKNEQVRIRVSAQPTSWKPEGYEGYLFGPMEWLSRYEKGPGYQTLSSWEGKLDGTGSIVIRTPVRVGEIRGTNSILIEGEVTSPTRQMIAGRTSVLAHGGEFSIGLRPSTTFLSVDSALSISCLAITPDGKVRSGVSLTLRVIQRVWNSVRKAESGGRYAWVSEEADSVRDSVRVMTTEKGVSRAFVPKRAGFYYIEAAATDARGNRVLTHAYFYVSGSDYVAWARSDDDRIELIADKANYAPGDVAQILVKSPYESAPALISLEREGILSHYTTTLTGSAPRISIPITREMLPNVFLSVVLLHGRTARPGASPEGDVGKPGFKVGYVQLPVSPKEKELRVSLELPRGDFRPGDTVSMSLRVQDGRGAGVPSEVTLSVADLGVLNLVNYRLPNPFPYFYRDRPLAVTTTETRMHIVEQREYGEKAEDEGGGGASAMAANLLDAEGLRMDFRPSAYWNPQILTDSSGAATVRFKLPDNLTAFEGMAVAQSLDGMFGYGERSFTVSKKLLCQPAMPRFARVGDAFTGGVVVINHSDAERSVTLVAAARGVQMSGKDTTLHTLKAGEAKEIRFTFTAERAGTASVTFRVSSGEEKDGLLWKIPVQQRRLRESVALYASMTEQGKEEQVTVPDSIDRTGEVELTASSSAMIGLAEGISYLFSYPYGCLEQKCSAVLPMILAKDLVEAFTLEVLKGKDHREVVTRALDELPLFQRENGGFAYWKNTPHTWPYPSAYAVYTLIQGKKKGYRIDEPSLKRGIEYLRRVLAGQEKSEYSPLASACTRALILYDLALSSAPDHGQMNRLFAERQDLPLFARAYLLRALHASGGSRTMQEELLRGLENQVKISPTSAHFEEPREGGLEWTYHSNTRTTALVMQALIETKEESPLIPQVVRWLMDRQKGGRWRTTQENLYVIDALATYFAVYEKEEPNFRAAIQVAGRMVLDELFSGRTLKKTAAQVPLSELPDGTAKVALAKTGPGRLYYGIRMNYTPLAEAQAKDEGISVTRTLEAGGVIQEPSTPLSAGTIVKITLGVMTNQDRNFVVVEDPIPAGFEMINSSFVTTPLEAGEEPQGSSWAFEHAEKYDDRALVFADYLPAGYHTFSYLARVVRPGTYAYPATRAEGMYEPEVFAQTNSGRMTIK